MKIHFITGTTGFVGRYLVDELLKGGDKIYCLIRKHNGVSASKRWHDIFKTQIEKYGDNLNIIEGDLLSEDLSIKDTDLIKIKNEKFVIWHLAANLSFKNEDAVSAYKTNYIGTKNIVKFANKYAEKMYYMSTAYVCGDAKKIKENELDIGQKFRNNYEKTKFKAESYVQKKCKIKWLVFRPSIIIGDAYLGKAKGCTFGYYRYAFIFHFLKKQIIKVLKTNSLKAKIFRVLKTKYNEKNDVLTIPWLRIPYPHKGIVDMVPVDYVVETAVKLSQKNITNTAIHLTHDTPPKFKFLLSSILHDQGFRGGKTIAVPAWLFKFLLKLGYLLTPSFRVYIKSITWYIPYITRRYKFELKTTGKYKLFPSKITREFISKINVYARENIFKDLEV